MEKIEIILEALIGEDFTFNLYAEEILYTVDFKNLLLNGYILDITEEEFTLEYSNLNQIHVTTKSDFNQYLLEEALENDSVICFTNNDLLKDFVGEISNSLFLYVEEGTYNTPKYRNYLSDNSGNESSLETYNNFFEKCYQLAEKYGFHIIDFIHQDCARSKNKLTFLKNYLEDTITALFNFIHHQSSSAILEFNSYLHKQETSKETNSTISIEKFLIENNVHVVINHELLFLHYNQARSTIYIMNKDFILLSPDMTSKEKSISLDLFEIDIISIMENFIREQADKELFYYIKQPSTFLAALLDNEEIFYVKESLDSVIKDLSLVLKDYIGEKYRIADNIFCDIYKSKTPAITDVHGNLTYLVNSKETEHQLTLVINDGELTDVSFVTL